MTGRSKTVPLAFAVLLAAGLIGLALAYAGDNDRVSGTSAKDRRPETLPATTTPGLRETNGAVRTTEERRPRTITPGRQHAHDNQRRGILVLDLQDRPVANIDVALRRSTSQTPRPSVTSPMHPPEEFLRLGTTDRDGRLSLAHIGLALRRPRWLAKPTPEQFLECVLDHPGLTHVRTPVDAKTLQTKTTVLRMPGWGRLRILVVDEQGEPIGTDPIGLRCTTSDRTWMATPRGATPEFRVGLNQIFTVLVKSQGLSYEPECLGPTQPNELRIQSVRPPPNGSIRVTVTPPRRGWAETDDVVVELQGNSFHTKHHLIEGLVTFQRVPLNTHFDLTVRALGIRKQERLFGPRHANAGVEAKVRFDDDILLTGQILSSAGKPLTNERLLILFQSQERRSKARIKTNDKGRFRCLEYASRMNDLTSASIYRGPHLVNGEPQPPEYANVPLPISQDKSDIGTVPLRKMPVLVAGWVSGLPPGGKGTSLVVKIEKLAAKKQQVERVWQHTDEFKLIWRDSTHFVCHALRPARRYRISLVTYGRRTKPLEFAPGTANLHVPLK